MASDTVAGELIKIALSKKASDSVRVHAILAVLDRAGISTKQQIEIEAKVETWERSVQGAVVDWGELGQYKPGREANVLEAEVVEDAEPHNATLHVSVRPDPHREQRMAEVAREVAALPAVPEPTPPWLSEESAADTATRRADEHRQAAFAAEKASKGLAPRTTRRR